jgi:hypothetical protein
MLIDEKVIYIFYFIYTHEDREYRRGYQEFSVLSY